MKPQLARGELRTVGAPRLMNTANTSRKTRARATLSTRVGHRTAVEAPSPFFGGLKERIRNPSRRAHPGLSLVAAATLSHRYITDRFSPTSD